MRDVYRHGRFNEAIDTILKQVTKVRDIYATISRSERSEKWHPFQAICEQCGKIGTTEVIAYDGKEVEYHCRPTLVSWATGCSYHGKVSPFDGNGKLEWHCRHGPQWGGGAKPHGLAVFLLLLFFCPKGTMFIHPFRPRPRNPY